MAAERFDIEIRDNVAKTIRQEILGIGAAARSTHASIRDMKTELSSLSRAQASATQATNASASAAAGRSRAADDAARAMQREKAAADALSRSYAEQARQARNQQNFTAFTQRGLSGKSAASSASVFNEAFDAAAAGRATSAQKKFVEGLDDLNKKTPLARQHLLNLGFQLNDVAVSLASGQRPLTVFVQQGAQIGQIAAQSGASLRGLAAAAARMVAPFLPVIAVVGAAVGVFALFNKTIKDSTSAEELTRGLNLTKEQMREMTDVTVTMGDTTKAVFQVIGRAIWDQVGGAVSSAWDTMKEWMSWIGSKVKDGINFMIGAWVASYRTIVATWRQFPAAIGDVFVTGVNMAIDAINDLISAAVNGVNGFLAQANTILPEFMQLPELSAPQIERVANQWAGAAREINDTFQREMAAAQQTDYLGNAWQAIRDQAVRNAQERLRAEAERKGFLDPSSRRQRQGKTEEEKRAEALAKVNRELASEIALLGFYGPALERENRFRQINNSLLDKGIQLTQAEEQSIRARILQIQEGTRVQEALNKIEQDALGPQRDYNANVQAITRALQDSIISEAEATRQRNLAKTSLEDALDPLRQYREEIARQTQDLTLYGRELEAVQRAREMLDRDVAAGVTTRDRSSVDDYMDQAREEQRRREMNEAFAAIDPRENQDPGSSSYILDHHREMYAELARLREEDAISEEEAARRKQNIDRAYLDARLEHTGSILGQISQLQQSKNKELAALGKAAAIAQATIDGYRAVQAALVGPPGPPWSFAIAGVTAAMTAANVARIAGIGFQGGGFTGHGADTSVAGQVHRNEFVFDSAATRRIGVGALEALRRGSSLAGGPANDNGRAPVVKIVPQPGVYVEERRTSDGEIELIAKRVVAREASKVVAQDIKGNPNSAASKAIGGAYGLKRADR